MNVRKLSRNALTRHMATVGKEIARIGHKNDDAAFNLWIPPHKRVLQAQRCTYSHQYPNQQTDNEDEKEYSHALKEAEYCQVLPTV